MTRTSHRQVLPLCVALASLLHGATSQAGPPYITDDPVPTDTGHWEVFTFADNHLDRHQSATEAGFDLNYGPAPDVQLTATLAMQRETGTGTDLADTELGFKYRLINSETHHFQLAVFPKVVLPTSRGPGKTAIQLPAWAQYDYGGWSLFGGGGITLQSGSGKRNFREAGIAIIREVRNGLSCGLELAHYSAEESGGHGSTTADAAFNLHASGPFSLVGAIGPVFENRTGNTAVRAYFGILANL